MANNQKSTFFTRKRLEEIFEFGLGGLFIGWILNEFIVRGLFHVFLVPTVVAVVLGGIAGVVYAALPKGDENDADAP